MSGPLPSILQPLTRPVSWGWRRVMDMRNRRFDRGVGVHRIDLPVISVGNLTTGGTGKTPMVRWIVERLLDDGHRPAIQLRGYGATDPDASDEACLYREVLSGVPIIAAPDRVGSLKRHHAACPETDCVLLDDGFQHRKIHRDLDLVLVDATRPFEGQRILPSGHLREPVSSLSRAHAVIITHAHAEDDSLSAKIEAMHGRPPLAWTDHQWTTVHVHEGSEHRNEDVSWLSGRRFVTRLGIGNPAAVHDQLERAGAVVVHDTPVRDHATFSRAELDRLTTVAAETDGVFMTRKDWVKARTIIDFDAWMIPVIVPELRMRFLSGQAAVVALLEGVMQTTGRD